MGQKLDWDVLGKKIATVFKSNYFVDHNFKNPA